MTRLFIIAICAIVVVVVGIVVWNVTTQPEAPAAAVTPDPARVAALAAAPERVRWWVDRIRACWPLLS